MGTKQAVARVRLVDDLTIYHAGEVKAQLMSALTNAHCIELDLSGVGAVDTAGVQLLLLAKREANQAGKAMAIVAHSEAVHEVIDFCHLASYFGDPVLITARRDA